MAVLRFVSRRFFEVSGELIIKDGEIIENNSGRDSNKFEARGESRLGEEANKHSSIAGATSFARPRQNGHLSERGGLLIIWIICAHTYSRIAKANTGAMSTRGRERRR